MDHSPPPRPADPAPSPLLHRLAAEAGIARQYTDVDGTVQTVSDETLQILLRALGVADVSEQALEKLQFADWDRVIAPTAVVRTGGDLFLDIYLSPRDIHSGGAVFVKLRGETGEIVAIDLSRATIVEIRNVGGGATARARVPLPVLTIGEWEIEAFVCGPAPAVHRGKLFVTPPFCYLSPTMARGERLAGLSVQLYSLREKSDLGAGTLRAAARFGASLTKEFAHPHGAGLDLLGISPLHATPNREPRDYSPYCPLSRVWKNSIFIDVAALPEVAASPRASKIINDPAIQKEIAALRAEKRVLYQRTSELQFKILHAAFADFNISVDPAARGEFLTFQQSRGDSLLQFAVFMALRDHFLSLETPIGYFREWPAEYQNPRSAAVADFCKNHRNEIDYYCFVQWLCARELADGQKLLKDSGMEIGFYHDLAVGSSSGSADAWARPEIFVYEAEIGAPPDVFNKEGQVWGVLPMSPLQLKKQHYEPFIQMLRAAMAGGGAVRIDHVMALWRLWWVPRGRGATRGAYIQYPADELLGILALESWRNQCCIIGEDLGTVPPGVRERMERERILGCRLSLFERTGDGGFIASEHYPKLSVASFSTHDLPTLAGFWLGRDIDTRARLKLYKNSAEESAARDERRRDRERWIDMLSNTINEGENIKLTIESPAADVIFAFYKWLGRAGSAIVLGSVEDALGEEHQRNVPGTTHEYPNWVARLPVATDEIITISAFRAAVRALVNGVRNDARAPLYESRVPS